MANRKRKRYRLVLVRTKPAVKLLILLAVVLSTIALVALRANIEEGKTRYEAMRQYAITLEGVSTETEWVELRYTDCGRSLCLRVDLPGGDVS